MATPLKKHVNYRDAMELSQLGLLGSQVDMGKFSLIMSHTVGIKLAGAITDAKVSRTIDGASWLRVTIADPKRTFLRSGVFANKMDVEVDGLWWRLSAIAKQGDFIDLTFEEREVALLRLYTRVIPPISREEMTRAQFVLKLLKEVEEVDIPYWIPSLLVKQPIFNEQDLEVNPAERGKGIATSENLTVQGAKADPIQIANSIAVLETMDIGIEDDHPHKHKLLVCSMMTCIVESWLRNLLLGQGDDDSVGLFQQIAKYNWPASNDIVRDTNAYLEHILREDSRHPTAGYGELCQLVQGSAYPHRYEKWKQEGEAFVSAWGHMDERSKQDARFANQQADYAALEGSYHFYRGIPPSTKNPAWGPESSWSCIQRLAKEVQWRAFFVSGIFYYMKEDELFQSMPRAIWADYDDGIDSIDGDYDLNKKVAACRVDLRMGRYDVPPGCVVKLRDMGPFNGRWLVNTVERDMYSPSGTIDLKKPDPALAELFKDKLEDGTQAYSGAGYTAPPGTTPDIPIDQSGVIGIAEKILAWHDKDRYRDGNGKQMEQWRLVADGKLWTSQCRDSTGEFKQVVCTIQLAQCLLWLLDAGWRIGTTALCQDHHCNDGEHPKGAAMDIGMLGRAGVGWRNMNSDTDLQTIEWIKQIMIQIRDKFKPRIIICEGTGYHRNAEIAALQWINGANNDWYHEGDHLNHIHVSLQI